MNQGLCLMFRPRKLTFKDVLIRSGINVNAKPVEVLIVELNKYWAGEEANISVSFVEYGQAVPVNDIEVFFNEKCIAHIYAVEVHLSKSQGLQKWNISIADRDNNWSENFCWSEHNSVKAL